MSKATITNYLTPKQAAALHKPLLSFSSLAKSRMGLMAGPPFVRRGRRILYPVAELERWIASLTVVPCPTSRARMAETSGPRRRGRPTKAEQIARAARAAEAAAAAE